MLADDLLGAQKVFIARYWVYQDTRDAALTALEQWKTAPDQREKFKRVFNRQLMQDRMDEQDLVRWGSDGGG